jgi:hypothetical protein
MAHVISLRSVVGPIERALAIVVGFIMMIVGLGLGVTMIMLPLGLVIGLLGFGLFVGGLFVRIDAKPATSR